MCTYVRVLALSMHAIHSDLARQAHLEREDVIVGKLGPPVAPPRVGVTVAPVKGRPSIHPDILRRAEVTATGLDPKTSGCAGYRVQGTAYRVQQRRVTGLDPRTSGSLAAGEGKRVRDAEVRVQGAWDELLDKRPSDPSSET